jgi:hypothetical protein
MQALLPSLGAGSCERQSIVNAQSPLKYIGSAMVNQEGNVVLGLGKSRFDEDRATIF